VKNKTHANGTSKIGASARIEELEAEVERLRDQLAELRDEVDPSVVQGRVMALGRARSLILSVIGDRWVADYAADTLIAAKEIVDGFIRELDPKADPRMYRSWVMSGASTGHPSSGLMTLGIAKKRAEDREAMKAEREALKSAEVTS
jgi:hypothetical protein